MAGTRVALSTAVALLAVGLLVFGAYEFSENPSNQLFGKTIVSGPANERIVALTYDDGPNPPYTDRILDVLGREHVHATFFVVGEAVVVHPQDVRRERRDGHAIGNHTWAHDHMIVEDRAHVRDSLRRTDAAIFAAAGIRPRIMRPPFGARDWLVLDEVHRLGYTPIMWSVPLARDWEDPPSRVIAGRILPYVRDGSIIVLHDGNRGLQCGTIKTPARMCDRSTVIAATQMIVESLKKQGYRFVTIPELLALRTSMHTASHENE